MAAEPAYRLDLHSAFAAETAETAGAPRVRATRSAENEQSQTALLVTAARLAAIVFVVIAALSFARIALTSATVSTMIESDAISSEIQSARASGVSLEMEQSVLSNPSAIKVAAKKLGMAAPYEVGVITLAPDVVSVDASGDLSLAGTVKNLVAARG